MKTGLFWRYPFSTHARVGGLVSSEKCKSGGYMAIRYIARDFHRPYIVYRRVFLEDFF